MTNDIIASFDVDAQNGFTENCKDQLPVKGGTDIVFHLNKQAEIAHYRVGSKDAHPEGAIWEADEDNPVLSPVGSPNVDVRWPRHCIAGTYSSYLLDGLPPPEKYDYFVWKGVEKNLHPYGACYHDLDEKLSTGVIEFLKSKDVRIVIVGGLAYSFCVKITALQLKRAGFKVYVNKHATRDLNEEMEKQTTLELKDAGVIVVEEPFGD